MKRFYFIVIFVSLLLAFTSAVSGQTDELRQATGLPIQIGSPALYGRVIIKRFDQNESRPSVHVTLLEGGSQLERVQTNDAGYYYFSKFPRGNATLVFEVNNNEVGRVVISTGESRNIRQDITLDWQEIKQLRDSTIDVRPPNNIYVRNAENEKAFNTAMGYVKEKKNDKAILLFSDVIQKDPKDFVAWTELGTVYFKENSLANAEACYFKAIELKKDYFVALLNLGKLYFSRKQFDNAILVLSNAIKSVPDSADAHHYIGESYLGIKKGTLAAAHLNEAIRLAPIEKAEIHLRLAVLYDAAKMKNKAAAEYKLFLTKRPDYAERKQLEKYIADNSPK